MKFLSRDWEDWELPLHEKKRWAKAHQTFELGIWGHDLELIKGIDLTTHGEYRNNWENMKQDNRNLRKALRQEGIISEDCFCAEISPKNHLLHLHGFYRLSERKRSADLHSIVSDHWERIHGAPVVWVQDVYSLKGLQAYNLKHALKNYANSEFGNMRLLKSRGWLPKGWKDMKRVMVRWALEHGAKWDWLVDDVPVWEEMFGYEYLPYAWEIMKEKIWRWCNDEVVKLDFMLCDIYVAGNQITEVRN